MTRTDNKITSAALDKRLRTLLFGSTMLAFTSQSISGVTSQSEGHNGVSAARSTSKPHQRASMRRTSGTVCHVLHSLGVGGAEMLAVRMARNLGRDYRVLFACLDELGSLGEELQREGFPVQVFHRRSGMDGNCALRMGRWFRRERVDLIHAHQYAPFFYSLLARWAYRRPPILFMEHGRTHPDYPRSRRILANQMLLEARDRVVAVGQAVRQALIVNEGLPPERVSVIPNGVNLRPYLTKNSNRSGVRREIGIHGDDFMIIHVARLDPVKDHDTALRTLGKVLRVRPDARLIVVGDGPERVAIEGQIDKYHLRDNVRLLGSRNDVARLMSAADMFLLSSVSEGIPLTLIEAMASGLPIVSTDVGGVAEVVDDAVTGLLAPARDSSALADHVLRIAESPSLRLKLAHAGKKCARERFSEDRMMEAYEGVYQQMLNGSISVHASRNGMVHVNPVFSAPDRRHRAKAEESGPSETINSTPGACPTALSKVSFIIPVRNDASNLSRCLDSIAALDQGGADVEVVVIDNGSSDDSADVARAAGARVVHVPNGSVASLRNYGVRAARGSVLAFVDADHEIIPTWLVAALDSLSRRPDAAGVGAACWPPPSPTWVQRMYDALRGHMPGTAEVEWLGAGNLVVLRDAFEQVSGFDTSLIACEDVDLCNRLRRAGWRLLSDARLRNFHFGDPATLAELFRGELWRGRDNLRVTFRGPLSPRSLTSALLPAFSLAALVAIPIGVLFPATLQWIPILGLALAGLLPLLHASRILRRLDRWGWREAIQAYAVAVAYDTARALAVVLRKGHRHSGPVGPSPSRVRAIQTDSRGSIESHVST